MIPTAARAYVNHGRWIADCPRPGCGNALKLTPHQGHFGCGICATTAPVDWPADADEIWDVLQLRPEARNRNWFPLEHELAVRARCPHGQTVAELLDENVAHGVMP